MTLRLNGRVQRLELVMPGAQSAAQAERGLRRERTLIICRYPQETEAEALERWGIDPTGWGKVVWRQWLWPEREISHPMWLPGPHESYLWVESLTRGHAELEARRQR